MIGTNHRDELGRQAEQMAVSYFEKQGFTLCKRNYRFQKAEIDLIVQHHDLLVFVEVKARTHNAFGHAETFVQPRQQALYQLAASEYIHQTAWQGRVRFDVIALYKTQKKLYLKHFKDAFF